MITVDMTKAKIIAHDEASRATIRTNDAALQVSMDAASDADALKALMPATE